METCLFTGIICIGLIFAAFAVYDRLYGITPESELVMAQGLPEDVKETEAKDRYGDTRYTLTFRVKDLSTQVSSHHGSYSLLDDAIKSGGPVQLYVSTKKERLFSGPYLSFYKLAKDGKMIVTYNDTVAYKTEDGKYYGIGAMLFLVIGFIALHFSRMAASLKPDT